MRSVALVGLLALVAAVAADATAQRPAFDMRGDTAFRPPAQQCGNPPSTSLSVWLDGRNIDGSNNGTLANNDPVTTWQDLGSNNDDPTQAVAGSKPTFIASCIGGKACVRFDGGDVLNAVTAANFTFASNGNGSTVYTVVKQPAQGLGTHAATSSGTSTNRGFGHRYNTLGRASFFLSDGTSTTINANSANDAFTTTTFNIFTTTLRTASTPDLTGYINGSSVLTGSGIASASAPANPLAVGAAGGGATSFLTGDVAQVLMYAVEHDSTQRAAVSAWLSCVYGAFPVTP
jgi:RES domain-containing protein